MELYKKDTGKLERVQQRTTEVAGTYRVCEERLRRLGSLRLEKGKLEGELFAVFHSLTGGGDRLLMEGHNGRMRSNAASCSRGIFCLDIKISWCGGGKALENTRGFKPGANKASRNLQSLAALFFPKSYYIRKFSTSINTSMWLSYEHSPSRFKHLLKTASKIDCSILIFFKQSHRKITFCESFYISRDSISHKRALDWGHSVVLFSPLIIFRIIPFQNVISRLLWAAYVL